MILDKVLDPLESLLGHKPIKHNKHGAQRSFDGQGRFLEKQPLRWKIGNMTFIRKCSWDQHLGKKRLESKMDGGGRIMPPRKDVHILKGVNRLLLCGQRTWSDVIETLVMGRL